MCGITGIWAFNEVGRSRLINLEQATLSLAHRGPDHQGTFYSDWVGLGHRRLSVIDQSTQAHQPFQTSDGRYVMTFNGEIFNYQSLKKELMGQGVAFQTHSDTEVLLQLYAMEGKSCLEKLNGFFAFAIFDTHQNSLFLARDRFGIKPLLYFEDEFKLLFASEMQSIVAYGIAKETDLQALSYYLQLHYVPAPFTMLKGVKKLEPGHYLSIESGKVEKHAYYRLPQAEESMRSLTYPQAQRHLADLLSESVRQRLIADVPVGCFLSGGIDSSVIAAVASGHVSSFSTFSMGFKGHRFFDETQYAKDVAKKLKTDHTTFYLSDEEVTAHLPDIVDRFDEPFADSSAIAVHLLSKRVKKSVKVALSGDGADEVFSGYNKHAAWWKMENHAAFVALMKLAYPLAKHMPKSRATPLSNSMRQIVRFVEALPMTSEERYWFLASVSHRTQVYDLMKTPPHDDDEKDRWLGSLKHSSSVNEVLRTDIQLVLPNDMLKKVDAMSMAHGLEVRVPFLDRHVVDFVVRLPESMKINRHMRKRILQDTYRHMLPRKLYQRPKKGFEMPLHTWLNTCLTKDMNEHVFQRDKIEQEGFFHWREIAKLKIQLQSKSPEDSPARTWALYLFQKWIQKHGVTS